MPYLAPKQQPNKKLVTLFNPDREIFTFSYDGGKEEYNLYPMSYQDFPAYVAMRMANKLAEKIIGKNGIEHNFELDKKELLERIIISNG